VKNGFLFFTGPTGQMWSTGFLIIAYNTKKEEKEGKAASLSYHPNPAKLFLTNALSEN